MDALPLNTNPLSPYLDRQSLFRLVAIIYLIFVAISVAAYVINIDGLMDPNGADRVGRDFVIFWTGGHQVWTGGTDVLYDRVAYDRLLSEHFGEFTTVYVFSYPPHALFLLAPFGLLGYLPALLAWGVGGVAAYVASARSLFKRRADRLILIFAPTTLMCLMTGQTGLYASALFVGGYQLKDKRPLLAGVLFGLLTVKPQMGVLLALVLLITRNWRTIFAAIVTTLGLIGASAALFGPTMWVDYITHSLPYQASVISMDFGIFDHMVPTAYKFIINLGGSVNMAWAAQGIVMVACVCALLWGYLRGTDARLKLALLCVLTGLFSPYMAIYDFPLYTVGVLLSASAAMREPGTWRAHPLLWATLLVTPFLNIGASMSNIPLGFLAAVGLSGLILWQLKREPVTLG